MRLKPENINEQTFRVTFRGFDTVEVDGFLNRVADEFERMLDEKATLELELDEERIARRNLEEALSSARHLQSSMVEKAKDDARITLNQAKLLADRITDEARQEALAIRREIATLKEKRAGLLSEVAALAHGLTQWVNRVEDDFDESRPEDNYEEERRPRRAARLESVDAELSAFERTLETVAQGEEQIAADLDQKPEPRFALAREHGLGPVEAHHLIDHQPDLDELEELEEPYQPEYAEGVDEGYEYAGDEDGDDGDDDGLLPLEVLEEAEVPDGEEEYEAVDSTDELEALEQLEHIEELDADELEVVEELGADELEEYGTDDLGKAT